MYMYAKFKRGAIQNIPCIHTNYINPFKYVTMVIRLCLCFVCVLLKILSKVVLDTPP